MFLGIAVAVLIAFGGGFVANTGVGPKADTFVNEHILHPGSEDSK